MPLEDFTPGWRHAHIGVEGAPVFLNGLNPWGLSWLRVAEKPIVVPHPSYPTERHKVWVYEVEKNGKKVKFAAGELSNGVWGFYVPA